jgi:hypothetical protein
MEHALDDLITALQAPRPDRIAAAQALAVRLAINLAMGIAIGVGVAVGMALAG